MSHVPPRAQWAMHRLDARIWKVIICRPRGMQLFHGPDGISTTGKKGQPIRILCSIVVCYQRHTKTWLWPPLLSNLCMFIYVPCALVACGSRRCLTCLTTTTLPEEDALCI